MTQSKIIPCEVISIFNRFVLKGGASIPSKRIAKTVAILAWKMPSFVRTKWSKKTA
jgi:hypothetical protein